MKRAFILASLILAACGPGEMGPPGPKGEDGSGLESHWRCVGTVSIGNRNPIASYDRYNFADESSFTVCQISYLGADESSDHSVPVFRSALFAVDGSCSVKHDGDPATASRGSFEFTVPRNASTGQVKFNDEDSAYHGTTKTLNCSPIL